MTNGIIKNTEPDRPHGYAPSCSLYAANDSSWDALLWALKQGCTIISQSFSHDSEVYSGDLWIEDHFQDHLATTSPFPFISKSAGNFEGEDALKKEWVTAKGYNLFAVGNNMDNLNVVSGGRLFRNPNTPHGDRKLPEICANGMNITCMGAVNQSGTSFASPAVAGAAALLQQANPAVISWPEAMRAIFLAGARRLNQTTKTWYQEVQGKIDANDGAGALDVEESRRIAMSMATAFDAPKPCGWARGTMSTQIDFVEGKSFKEKFFMRADRPAGENRPPGDVTFKIALAWDSKVVALQKPDAHGGMWGSRLSIDLDLLIWKADTNTAATWSSSFDNSYEIAEFVGTEDTVYYIDIRLAGSDSIAEATWYGLAWTSHK